MIVRGKTTYVYDAVNNISKVKYSDIHRKILLWHSWKQDLINKTKLLFNKLSEKKTWFISIKYSQHRYNYSILLYEGDFFSLYEKIL